MLEALIPIHNSAIVRSKNYGNAFQFERKNCVYLMRRLLLKKIILLDFHCGNSGRVLFKMLVAFKKTSILSEKISISAF